MKTDNLSRDKKGPLVNLHHAPVVYESQIHTLFPAKHQQEMHTHLKPILKPSPSPMQGNDSPRFKTGQTVARSTLKPIQLALRSTP
jgi:hypothetical protein